MGQKKIRRATHAGSWYQHSTLQAQLQRWLDDVPSSLHLDSCVLEIPDSTVKGIIAPHAGYSYSGSTAAYAYKCIDPKTVKTVFLLGPSHHYETPFGNLTLNAEVISELHGSGDFGEMSLETDEAEHSIEMHLPILYSVLKETIFIISSDFCHWGSRFNYTPKPTYDQQIFEFIESLDHEGMELIEKTSPEDFTSYLKRTRNTICGRHPIGVFLNAVKAASPGKVPSRGTNETMTL
ncbi:memo-like protein-domain-containing protein [Chytridium lagenaria]|nr:memo-like protein-domain-containing protein [Chytridium lagenaria]